MRALAFSSTVSLLGVNAYVEPPERVLRRLFVQAGKETSPIPVRGTLNGAAFRQTLVKYGGAWRLYLNVPMLRAADLGVGGTARVTVAFDPRPRKEPMHPRLAAALAQHPAAQRTFDALPPSRRKEILRYLNAMKTEASLERNVGIVVGFLQGEKPRGLRALLRA